MAFALGTTLAAQLKCWRAANGHSLECVADALGVSTERLVALENDQTLAPRHLRYRTTEMMRSGSDEQLALRRHLVDGLSSFVALIDLGDLSVIAVSRGLKTLWPELGERTGLPFLPHMTPEAKALIQDESVLNRIRQGQIVSAQGVSERSTSVAARTMARHRWSVSFTSYGTRMVGEIWYDPAATTQGVGVHNICLFDDIVDVKPS